MKKRIFAPLLAPYSKKPHTRRVSILKRLFGVRSQTILPTFSFARIISMQVSLEKRKFANILHNINGALA